MPVVSAGVHGSGIDRTESITNGPVIRICRFGHIVAIHVKTQRKARPFSAVKIRPEARQAAIHHGNQLRIGSLGNGSFLMRLQHVRSRNTHHGFPFHGIRAHCDGIAQRFQMPDRERGRAKLCPARFGMLMNIAPTGRQFRRKPFQCLFHTRIHDSLPEKRGPEAISSHEGDSSRPPGFTQTVRW